MKNFFCFLLASAVLACGAFEPAEQAAYSAIEQTVAQSDAKLAAEQAALTETCSLADYAGRVKSVSGTNVWTEALQTALREHAVVRIPASKDVYWIDATVVIPSNRRIEAAGATISLLPGTTVLMLRNESAPDGTLAPIPSGSRNRNIAIVGGRWEDWTRNRRGYGGTGRFDLGPRKVGAHYGVSTLFYFGNCDAVTVKDVTFAHTSGFALQAGDGVGHLYANIRFESCYADGLHLNGNLENVHVRNVKGKVGDDLVALNAYDWLNSSINFGPQKNVLCEDLELVLENGSGYPAIRIQPAKYRYQNGAVVDCAISDVIFRRVKGIKTFKMYLQTPRYRIGTNPEWSEVGSGGNLFFDDITVDLASPIDLIGQYRDSEPVRGHYGAFEFGANLSSVHFRNIDITFHLDRYPLGHLATVGPKSCFFPDAKGGPGMEIFDPYVNCRVGHVTVEGLHVRGPAPAELVKAVVFDDINKDGRSSGRGVIAKLDIRPAATKTVSGQTGTDIQRAIDEVAARGGGRVVVPAGDYSTGSIRLRSFVDLHLERGARLLGGTKSEDYADFPDDVCSIHPEKSKKVFIYAYDAKDIALTGEGVVDGQGPFFFDRRKLTNWGFYPKPPIPRPRMVQFVRCSGVRMRGVTFKDSPCWTMLIRLCDNIDVDGITVTADQHMLNNDGIDFDGCRHIRVVNSKFKTGDDCLILRAMREKSSAERVVCEDVVVSNCVLNSFCQTIRLGCPSDDTIRNALFTDIQAEGNNGIFADYPVRYLRPDDDGYMDIRQITVQNYRGTFRGSAVQIVSEPGVKVRNVDGFTFRNLDVTSARPLRFIGNKGHEIKSVLMENVTVNVPGNGVPVDVQGCSGLVFKNVTVRGQKQPDGPVASKPGSSAPMGKRRTVSWETQKKDT